MKSRPLTVEIAYVLIYTSIKFDIQEEKEAVD